MRIKLGEVFKLSSGKSLPEKNRTAGEYNVYGGNGITGNHNIYFVSDKTIVIGRVGEYCGASHLTTDKCWVTDNALMVTEWFIPVNLEFMVFALKALNINRFAKTVGQPSISQGTIYDLEIDLPTIQEQEKIVKELCKIEQIIEKRKQQLVALDNIIKSRFVELFGNPITNEKGWDVVELNSVCDGIGDGLHGTPEYDENGEYPFINGNNLMNGIIEITPVTRMVNEETYKKHFIELTDNAILLSINGTLGKLAFYNGEEVMLGKSACYCNLKPEINREFVYGVMKTDGFAGFLESNATASTIKNVGLKVIRGFKLILPPEELQIQFVEFSKQVDKSKVDVQKSLNKTQKLFDSIMQKYFK